MKRVPQATSRQRKGGAWGTQIHEQNRHPLSPGPGGDCPSPSGRKDGPPLLIWQITVTPILARRTSDAATA